MGKSTEIPSNNRLFGGSAARKNFGGRPPKLNDALIERICLFLRAGSFIETATAASGISKTTFYDWLNAGNECNAQIVKADGGRHKFTEMQRLCMGFSDAVGRAMAEAEIADLMVIRRASLTDWRAAAWRLERMHPEQWGRR
jgi:hypothetical protein